jgi:hypothetical protein
MQAVKVVGLRLEDLPAGGFRIGEAPVALEREDLLEREGRWPSSARRA